MSKKQLECPNYCLNEEYMIGIEKESLELADEIRELKAEITAKDSVIHDQARQLIELHEGDLEDADK